jgi:hypothetical protein
VRHGIRSGFTGVQRWQATDPAGWFVDGGLAVKTTRPSFLNECAARSAEAARIAFAGHA